MENTKQARFNQQCELARAELEKAGVSAQRIHPLTHRLLELFGIRFKPPFHTTFISNFLVFALSNTLLCFLLLNVILWGSTEYTLLALGQSALLLGSLIGIVIARLYELGYKRHNLKSWAELGAMLGAEIE
ncbi:MAG: DUF6404 family protein [Pseudomonadales bacterium]|nr:DUF6404 family protein [Pseudomonadales bacterium]